MSETVPTSGRLLGAATPSFVCGRCHQPLTLTEFGPPEDGVRWRHWVCPTHGPMGWMADAGELDLGVVRESAGENKYEAAFVEMTTPSDREP